jgi:hypothetical protein
MRTTLFLSCLLLVSAIIWAQGIPVQPAPAAGGQARAQGGIMANPPTPPHMGGPEVGEPQLPPGAACDWRHHHHRGGRIVGLVLGVIVALSASFALVALGIFLIRRSTMPPVARS